MPDVDPIEVEPEPDLVSTQIYTRRRIMPAIPPKNYLSTIDSFVAHWTLVNALPGGTPLVLFGAYALTNITADRTALVTQLALVETNEVAALTASADRDIKRANMGEKIRQFNSTVRGLLPRTIYPNSLPRVPSLNSAPGLWMRAMDEAAAVWNRVNTDVPPPAITLPLVLTGPYARAGFVTDQTALITAFTTQNTAFTVAETARNLRDVQFDAIYDRLVQYRRVIQGRFPKTHQLYQSLPVLRSASGSTPDPVNVGSEWIATLNKARITHTASTDPRLSGYQLRGSIGGTRYDTNNETVIATNPPGVLVFETNVGLVASGSTLYAKVYVLTDTGNEKGSKSIKIVRP